jgi:mannonate dehydratase
LQVFAKAEIPIARQRFAGDASPGHTSPYRSVHRGGYRSRGEYVHEAKPDLRPREEIERWWDRFSQVYARLVPVAEEYGIQLAIHPSDTPYPGTPFDGLGLQRVLDAFPSRNVGLLYCVGTRAEAGGSPLVLDEINHFGRKGRIMTVHFRNVRGSLATAGGFEEVLLDDGDINMFRVLLELHKIGFAGCVNPDHIPHLEGDSGGAGLGLAYSIGYIRALLAALAIVS